MEEQFETLESAQDFVALLAETVAEAKRELAGDLQRESLNSRRLDALRLTAYKIEKLESHLYRSRRILNDLRILRRLLLEERNTGNNAAQAHEPTLSIA
jgi:predicted ATPase